MAPVKVQFNNVSLRFGGVTALHQIDLCLSEPRIAVIGNNGSGKSTLARLINGLLLPDEGRVIVDGLDTRTEAPEVRRRVGFLFQNPDNQIIMPTVSEDVAFGLKNKKMSSEEVSERVDEILKRFKLFGLRNRSAHLLSGGEKQLLALAGVMVMAPSLLVFDEPTTLLDRRNARIVTQMIFNLDVNVILVTHHVELLKEFDRVVVLDGGRVVRDGPCADTVAYYAENLT